MRPLSVATLLILALSLFFPNATRADEPVTLARLVMRERTIIMASDANGLVYSIATRDGSVLEANLSEAELVAKYPDVYETIRPAIAQYSLPKAVTDGEATETVIPWAGM
jgi:hypothetical protein